MTRSPDFIRQFSIIELCSTQILRIFMLMIEIYNMFDLLILNLVHVILFIKNDIILKATRNEDG